MSASMAEVLAAHKFDQVKAVCTCSDEVQVGLKGDPQTHEEHVADVLAANGYGKLDWIDLQTAEAWDLGCYDGRSYIMARGDARRLGKPDPEIPTNPFRKPE